jgi:RNA recognition motif-containing protein
MDFQKQSYPSNNNLTSNNNKHSNASRSYTHHNTFNTNNNYKLPLNTVNPNEPHRVEGSRSGSSIENGKVHTKKLHISNIEWNVHDNLLKKFVQQFGEIKRCAILRDNVTNLSRGMAYVEFLNESDAEKMLNASSDQLTLSGRVLNVTHYREKNMHKLSKRHHRQERRRRNTEARSSVSEQEQNSVAGDSLDHQQYSSDSAARNGNLFYLNSGSILQDLPYNILINIFSNFSIRDLCVAEQGKMFFLFKLSQFKFWSKL